MKFQNTKYFISWIVVKKENLEDSKTRKLKGKGILQ